MPEPYLGEIRMFAGNFGPRGWALCQGQSMSIASNDALFALLGTTYGGDGVQTFNLPDLQGRVPLHPGTNAGITYIPGDSQGAESVLLTPGQLPKHSHPMVVSGVPGTLDVPTGNVLAATASGISLYYEGGVDSAMNAACITTAGGSQPHENMQPFLCVSFIIALEGIFPPQN